MCVPVPLNTGTQSGSPGTTPVTTQPTGATIDYSRYAGMSPYDVRTSNPNGLPVGWNWDEWMKVNPGAPDPRTSTNTGQVISPQNAALWNLARTPVDAHNFGAPGTTNAASRPVVSTNPASRSAGSPFMGTPAAPAPAAPAPVVASAPVPSTAPSPTAPSTGVATTPVATTAAPTYTANATYSGGLQPTVNPSTRVANALSRRFKPDGWFY